MHVLSKVCLGTVIVAALVAILLTSKLFKARGAWLQQVAQRQEQAANTEEDLRKQRLVVAEARNEVNRLMNLWGNTWEPPPQRNQVLNPQQGAVAIGMGGNAGIGRREATAGNQLPSVYLFARTPQGQGREYLGEFRLTTIEADRAGARLTRAPYADETQQWPAGPWRVRESIPGNWQTLFTGLQAETAEALQDVQDQNVRQVQADELNAKSQEQLLRRLNQLEGSPNALEGSSREVVDGLVQSLRQAETTRNEDLGRLDELRHEYDRKYRQLMELNDQNRRLEAQLPQSGATSPPAGEQQAVGTDVPTTR